MSLPIHTYFFFHFMSVISPKKKKKKNVLAEHFINTPMDRDSRVGGHFLLPTLKNIQETGKSLADHLTNAMISDSAILPSTARPSPSQ